MKRILCLLLSLVMVVSVFASCGGKKGIVGRWYNSSGKCLDIRDDNTYVCEGSYGTGTWRKVDGGNFELVDFYGSVSPIVVETDENGKEYIKYNSKRYYRDQYPAESTSAATEAPTTTPIVTTPVTQAPATTPVTTPPIETDPPLLRLNPFHNIQFVVSGISPYCTVTVNNSNCSANVQQYVEYELDKDYYANGEKVVVKATVNYRGKDKFILTSDQYSEYTVTNQPEYVTSLQNVDLTGLRAELADYIAAGKAKISADPYDLFTLYYRANVDGRDFVSVTSMTNVKTAFSTLKANKYSDFRLGSKCFNRVSFVYKTDYTTKGDIGKGTAWFNISAENVVRYPDGRIEWGTKTIGARDFVCEHSTQGEEACVNATIMLNASNYNIALSN